MGSRQLRLNTTKFTFGIFDYLAKVVNVMILHVLLDSLLYLVVQLVLVKSNNTSQAL